MQGLSPERRLAWLRRTLTAALLALAVGLLVPGGQASAATCDFQGPGQAWQTAANWSCMQVPTSSDHVTLGALGSGDNVSLTGAADAGSVSLQSLSTVEFSPGATLTVAGSMSAASGTLSGDGTVSVSGAFSKSSSGQLTVRQGMDVVLEADSSLAGGSVCLQDLGGGDPSVKVNARLTIEPSAAQDAFNCSNGDDDVPHLLVSPSGELVKTGSALTRILTTMDNDGFVRAQSGKLQSFGTAGTAASDGVYLADAAATMEFNAPSLVGPGGRVGGAGTARISANVTLTPGATLDPQTLDLAGQTLKLQGSGPVSVPSVNLVGGTLDSTRELLPDALSVTTGTLSGNGTTTLQPGSTFSKTTAGQLTVRQGADLVLDVDSALAGGSICLQDLGGGDPSVQLNARLTLEPGASADAFNCSNGADVPHLLVNPGAELVKTGPGVKRVRTPMKNEGEVRVVEGTLQSFGTANASSEGEYLADAEATVEFNAPSHLGPGGRVGGAGTARVSAAVTLAAGATLDPQALELAGQTLKLEGSGAVTIPTVNLAGGTLDSTRELNPTALSVTSGTLRGNGTTTVPTGGSFSKTTIGQLSVRDGADLVLNVESALSGGSICLQDLGGGDPSVELNARLTIEETASEDAFNCSNGANVPHLLVGPAGELVKAGAGLTRVRSPMDNDGVVRSEQGSLQSFGTAGASSDGAYLAESGATVELVAPSLVGASGRVGGAGTARTAANVTMAAGATLDPHTLELAGQTLKLEGSEPVAVPTVNLVGGTLDSQRPLHPNALNAASGTLTGSFTTTVPPAGSFSKTTTGQLTIRQGADLVLNVNSSLSGGSICLQDLGGGDPSVQLNARLTIEQTANEIAFNCSNGDDDVPHLFVNATGELRKAGTGLTQVQSRTRNAGTVDVGAGHQLKFLGGYEQIGGLTRVASGGELIASVSLAGGVLAGSGQVTGNVLNTAGSVRPGASPGDLTIHGAYTQGAGGTLQTEISGTVPGTEFDRLLVTGNATLAGELAIVHDPGFSPSASDTFPLLSTARRSGTFSNVTGTDLPASFYVVAYNPADVTVARAPDPPQNTSPPTVSGNPFPGETLTCNPGVWTSSPTFAYQWLRDGAPVAGVPPGTYALTNADLGSQFVCRVTATNLGGSGEASSAAVTARVRPPAPPPPVKPPATPSSSGPPGPTPGLGGASPPPTSGGCLNLGARVSGRRFGPARLGRARATQRGVLQGSDLRTTGRLERYCVTGGGTLGIGYGRGRLKHTVVLVTASSARFSLKGIAPGMSERRGRRRFGRARRVRVEGGVWHAARRGGVLQLMRTRRGLVTEVGIADVRLTASPARTRRFLQSW